MRTFPRAQFGKGGLQNHFFFIYCCCCKQIMWSTDKERHLISLIKERPILYDANHTNHNSSAIVGKTWLEIANSIGVTKDQVRYKWRSLKAKYNKEQEFIKLKIIDKSQSEHYSAMAFISQLENDASMSTDESETRSNDRNTCSPMEIVEHTQAEHSKQVQPSRHLNNLKQIANMKSNKSEVSDWNFFLSLLQYTKLMKSYRQKLEFRIEASNLLRDYRKEDESDEDDDDIQVVEFKVQKKK